MLDTVKNPARNIKMSSVVSFLLAAGFLFYEMAIQVSPGVMASRMLRELSLSAVAFGWVMSAYYYSYSFMMLPVGLLFDRYSAKRLLMGAIALCVLGCVIFSLAHTAAALVFARFFTGLGSAFAFIGVLVVAARCFPIRYYAVLVGITQLLAAFGAMSGETPVALAVSSWGWRATMWGIIAVGSLLFIAITYAMRGICLRSSPQCYAVSAQQAVPAQHTLGQSLAIIFSKAQTYVVALYSFCAWAPVTFFASLWGVPYMMDRFAYTSAQASYAMDAMWLGIALGAPVLGWLVKRCGHRLLLVSSALIAFVCALAILYLPMLEYLWVCVLCFGVGIGAAANILCFDLVQINNPASEHATGVAVNNIALVVSGVVMQPAVGLLLQRHAHMHQQVLTTSSVLSYHVSDYVAALWLMPACYAVGLIVAIFFLRCPRVKQSL